MQAIEKRLQYFEILKKLLEIFSQHVTPWGGRLKINIVVGHQDWFVDSWNQGISI